MADAKNKADQAKEAAQGDPTPLTNEQLNANIDAYARTAQSEIDALKSENAELRTIMEKLTGDTETATTKLAIVEQFMVEKEEDTEALNVTVAKLSKAKTDNATGVAELPTPFTIGKGKQARTYRAAYPAIRFGGRKITAQELADDHELAQEVIDAGATILVEV